MKVIVTALVTSSIDHPTYTCTIAYALTGAFHQRVSGIGPIGLIRPGNT